MRAAATLARFDVSTSPAKLQLFDSVRPAAGEAAGVTPNAEIVLTQPAGTSDQTGTVLTANGPAQVLRMGSVQWGRFVDGAGAWIADANAGLSVALPAVSPPIVLDRVDLLVGGFVTLVGAVIAESS